MEQNNAKEKMNGFGGLNSIEMMIRNLEEDVIVNLKKLPFMQLFFDSELNSEIEKNALKGMCEALYSIIVEMTNGWGISLERAEALGSSIAHYISYTMGIAKLVDKYFHGEISIDQYYSELSKKLAVGAISFIKNNWSALGTIMAGGLRGILAYFGVPLITIESCISLLGKMGSLIKSRIEPFFNSANVQRFIEHGLRFAGKAFKKLTDVASKTYQTSKDAVKKTKQFVTEISLKIGVGFDQFRSSLKKEWNSFKEKAKDVGHRLKIWTALAFN